MKKILLGVFLVAVSVGLGAQDQRPTGKWKLDSAQSQNAQWKSATLAVTKDDDSGIAWTINGTGQDGKPVHESYSSAWDKEARIKGAAPGEVGTWHKDGSFDIKLKDGSTAQMTRSISDDGKTMTISGSMNGKNVKDVWVKSGKTTAAKSGGKSAKKKAGAAS